MSNIWILLKAQLINFFPINEIRDSRNKKQSSMAIASFGIITLSLFCFVYNIITAKTLVHVGQQNLIPAYMAVSYTHLDINIKVAFERLTHELCPLMIILLTNIESRIEFQVLRIVGF